MSLESQPVSEDLHIVSLIVHAMPQFSAEVGAAIRALPLAQIHGSDANGKHVVTLEASSSSEILDQVAVIQQADGVINVAMVYQHVEPLESLNAEMHHDHTT